MWKVRSAIILAILLGVLLCGLGLGWLVTQVTGPRTEAKALNTTAILKQVQNLSELVTVKYVIEKLVILEDVRWYGESRVLLVAHGIVKAGVDFSQMQPADLTLGEKKITVRLPWATITDSYLDEQKTQIIERSTGLLRQFDKDLEQAARRRAVEDIRRAARYSGIVGDAQQQARQQLKHFFNQLGFEQIEFIQP